MDGFYDLNSKVVDLAMSFGISNLPIDFRLVAVQFLCLPDVVEGGGGGKWLDIVVRYFEDELLKIEPITQTPMSELKTSVLYGILQSREPRVILR